MSSPHLTSFATQKYLNLESFKRDGTPVQTPVWFAEEQDILYVYTLANAGKVKRIRRNSRIRIAPCTMRGTVIGPWLVDAADVPDPGKLGLRTFVNGKLTQQGNTADLMTDVPGLIEYLSSFMTLAAGDVILTGTPQGVANVEVGDEVMCEIDGLGRLHNTIVSDAAFGR